MIHIGGDYRKVLRIILWIIISTIFILGLTYLFTGSLEWILTTEQQKSEIILDFQPVFYWSDGTKREFMLLYNKPKTSLFAKSFFILFL